MEADRGGPGLDRYRGLRPYTTHRENDRKHRGVEKEHKERH